MVFDWPHFLRNIVPLTLVSCKNHISPYGALWLYLVLYIVSHKKHNTRDQNILRNVLQWVSTPVTWNLCYVSAGPRYVPWSLLRGGPLVAYKVNTPDTCPGCCLSCCVSYWCPPSECWSGADELAFKHTRVWWVASSATSWLCAVEPCSKTNI